jgi:hypothetical protein
MIKKVPLENEEAKCPFCDGYVKYVFGFKAGKNCVHFKGIMDKKAIFWKED